jgi:uncharacterized protein (DUF1499 family)
MLRRTLLIVALLVLGVIAAIALHTATTKGDSVFSWKRPENLGVRDGRLPPCRRTPNCVSSQADPADPEHYIAPIAFRGGADQAIAAVRAAVEGMPDTRVIRSEPGYLYAEFRTRVMRFVDDVEFASDPAAAVIHVRSASRLGRRDFGVNRERVEALRRALERRS